MSTQTKTPAELAEEFLRKYATVIGTLDAIKEKDREFLLKYATVVGSPAAIDVVAPETSDDPSETSEDPVEPTVPTTDPTDPEEGTVVGGGDPIVEGEENE